ncbi:MAG TPA: Rieske (2Fe-2S) protein [Candidatus Limnocylindrales bacterium]|nr:Rieske (2Fe-2S) protein [Candidatus Limnocylindrales bacterium]
MNQLLIRLMDAQTRWAKPLGDAVHGLLNRIFQSPLRPLKDFLNGTWLGHPIHAAITDVPIGAFTVTVVLDLANQRAAADIALVVGILTMLGAALAGFADYTDTDGTARTRASLHSTLMIVALVIYLVSLAQRAGDPTDRTVPVVLSIVAYLIVLASAYVGGDVVYALGNMVSRHAFAWPSRKWRPLQFDGGDLAALPEGEPARAQVGDDPVVLVRVAGTVHALHETCAHAGGPLAEGRVVDGCIECPWHQSRFRLRDGTVAQGPAVYDQPRYEVRAVDAGGWEARRLS